jgi:hypothetical protein
VDDESSLVTLLVTLGRSLLILYDFFLVIFFRNWTMKHLLYLQLRRNLLEQQIQCDIDQHLALSGLALQSEFGDYTDQVKNQYF